MYLNLTYMIIPCTFRQGRTGITRSRAFILQYSFSRVQYLDVLEVVSKNDAFIILSTSVASVPESRDKFNQDNVGYFILLKLRPFRSSACPYSWAGTCICCRIRRVNIDLFQAVSQVQVT
jgi:hypothetical protein